MASITFGKRKVDWPSEELGELRDANELLGDHDALTRRMEEDGYLLLRQLIDPNKVTTARQHILQFMAEHEALEPDTRPLDGVMGQYGKSVRMLGKKPVTHQPQVQAALEADELFEFFGTYFNEPARSFDYKWLRAVGHEEFTGAHYDVVYMGRGSERLHTCWLPLGELEPNQGTLAICVGSHNAPSFAKLRETYGRVDVDRDGLDHGWFTRNFEEINEKFGGQWATAAFKPGDVLIFGMYTMHASTTNETDRWRISCDVRFQPVSDPIDERWVGDDPVSHTHTGANASRKMEDVRAQWGF